MHCVCCSEKIDVLDDATPSLSVISDDYSPEYDSLEYKGSKWDEIEGPICNLCLRKVEDSIDYSDDAGPTIKQSDWEKAGFYSPLS